MKNLYSITEKGRINKYVTLCLSTIFLLSLSCSKENIQPISDDNASVLDEQVSNKEKGLEPFIMLSTGKLYKTKITNSKGKFLGDLSMISDGSFMKVYFKPGAEKVLLAAYLHYDLKNNFPVERRTGLPSLEKFDHKFEFQYRVNEDSKSADSESTKLTGKLVFKIPIQDVPKSGIMALQIRCKNSDLDNHYNSNGIGWMDGIRFADNSEASYLNYSLGWKF